METRLERVEFRLGILETRRLADSLPVSPSLCLSRSRPSMAPNAALFEGPAPAPTGPTTRFVCPDDVLEVNGEIQTFARFAQDVQDGYTDKDTEIERLRAQVADLEARLRSADMYSDAVTNMLTDRKTGG